MPNVVALQKLVVASSAPHLAGRPLNACKQEKFNTFLPEKFPTNDEPFISVPP